MTNIEQKALELVNEVAQDVRYEPDDFEEERRDTFKALCRAIERHEAFRQEVSDTLEKRGFYIDDRDLGRFIIPKPDPLVEVIAELGMFPAGKDNADQLRAALAKRGLEIREKRNDHSSRNLHLRHVDASWLSCGV